MACTCKIFQGMNEENNVKIVYINDRYLETECLVAGIIEHTLWPKYDSNDCGILMEQWLSHLFSTSLKVETYYTVIISSVLYL